MQFKECNFLIRHRQRSEKSGSPKWTMNEVTCCVLQPATRCRVHPKAALETFLSLTFFFFLHLFSSFDTKRRKTIKKCVWSDSIKLVIGKSLFQHTFFLVFALFWWKLTIVPPTLNPAKWTLVMHLPNKVCNWLLKLST